MVEGKKDFSSHEKDDRDQGIDDFECASHNLVSVKSPAISEILKSEIQEMIRTTTAHDKRRVYTVRHRWKFRVQRDSSLTVSSNTSSLWLTTIWNSSWGYGSIPTYFTNLS